MVTVNIEVLVKHAFQAFCYYFIIKGWGYPGGSSFLFIGFLVALTPLRLNNTKKAVQNDMNDFYNTFFAYPDKKFSKEVFFKNFRPADSERGLYIKKKNLLAIVFSGKLTFAKVVAESNGEITAHVTYYDYL